MTDPALKRRNIHRAVDDIPATHLVQLPDGLAQRFFGEELLERFMQTRSPGETCSNGNYR